MGLIHRICTSVGTLVVAAACGGGGNCPRPTIAAVPPSKLPQQAFPLPLGEQGRHRAAAYLKGCEGDQTEGCARDLNSEEFCALEYMIDSGDYPKKLLRCSGAVKVEVYDPRALHPLVGVALGGWVFAFYRDGIPPGAGKKREVLVFPDQVPKPVE
jgi:hypothetical protein